MKEPVSLKLVYLQWVNNAVGDAVKPPYNNVIEGNPFSQSQHLQDELLRLHSH